MGKKEKKQRHQHKQSHRTFFNEEDEDFHSLPSSAFSSSLKPTLSEEEEGEQEQEEEENDGESEEKDPTDDCPSSEIPSKFLLYQQSVQVWF